MQLEQMIQSKLLVGTGKVIIIIISVTVGLIGGSACGSKFWMYHKTYPFDTALSLSFGYFWTVYRHYS